MPRQRMDTQYTHHGHQWGLGGCYVPPLGKCPLRWTSWGPKATVGGRTPHHQYGVSTWKHLANSEGSCPPLCGPDTEQ